MLHALEEKGIYVSSGSACSKGALSGTLAAFHIPPERVRSALRISFSYETDAAQIDAFAAALREVIDRLMRVVHA
jgi:cysteine desulfurase